MLLKAGHGLSRSYDTNLGKICILFGGFVLRNETDWPPKSMSVKG